MLLCIILGAAAAVLGAIAIAAGSIAFTSRAHYRERLLDKSLELDRASLRIDQLERMLDEARAAALHVSGPLGAEMPSLEPLPPKVVDMLADIEDEGVRAEMAADIRIQLEQTPDADPVDVARTVIGA
jgi:hypothetical protein